MLKNKNKIKKVGVFKSGWGRNADGQRKRHVEQMTKYEKKYLAHMLQEMHRSFKIHPHLQDKKRRGLISYDILTIRNTLNSPSLFKFIREYSEIKREGGETDRRVLIRSPKKERVYIKGRGNLMCNLLFVISLNDAEVITAYYSHKNHQYVTNKERYDASLQIY